MARRFIDTNILIRFLTEDDTDKAAQAFELLTRVRHGKEEVITSPLVIFEVVFTLERSYKVSKDKIAQVLEPILTLADLILENKPLWREAFQLYTTYPIDFADAYNAAYMHSLGISDIYSWDEDFDGLPDITRLEPPLKEADAA